MESKLGLNFELVNEARTSAAHVAADVQRFIDQHTTVTVERAICRLLGIDGVNEMDVPMPNVVVDNLMENSLLPLGAAWVIGNAILETGLDPQGVAEAIDKGELDLTKLPAHSDSEIRAAIKPYVDKLNQQIMFAEKSWGHYHVLEVQKGSMTILTTLNPGSHMSYHSHERRDEVWTVIRGSGKTLVDGMEQQVRAGDVITMAAGSRHTVTAGDEGLQLIEVQIGDINAADKRKYER
jgi:mannose-6-phosphate isomerase-like protein (cupin superfamily)